MAKTKISEYDSTAANNTDIDSINIAEGMAPSNVNNAIRELMAHLKDGLGAGTPVFLDQTNNVVGIGTSTSPSSSDVKLVINSSGGGFAQFNFNGGAGSAIGAAAASTLAFYTTTGNIGSDVYTERMRINSDGDVGIGTNNPAYGRLHIADGNSDIAMDANGSGQLHIDGNGYGFGIALNASGAQIYTNTASRDLIFGVDETERMRITDGNVGIGTTSPARGLHVNNNGESFIRITSSDTGNAGIEFGDQSDGVQGAILQNSTDNSLRFNGYNNSERMRIDSVGVASMGSTSKTFASIDATRLAVVGGSNGSSNAVQMIVDEDSTVEGGSTLLAIGFSADNSFSTANYINFFDSGGQQGRIEGAGAGSVAYQTSSDRRLKSNIRDTGSKWDALKQIQVRDYEWTADTSNKTVTGFIAQELHTIFPDAVSEGDEDVTKKPWAVDYGRTTPIIIKALQEAIAKIETLETQNTTQATQIADLITRVEALEGA